MKMKLSLLLFATLALVTPLTASAQEFCVPFNDKGEQVCYSGVFPADLIIIELGQPIRLPATVLQNLTKGAMNFKIEWAGIDVAGSGVIDARQLASGETVNLNDLAFEIEGLDLGTRKIAIGFSAVGAYTLTVERRFDLTVVIPGQLREIIQVPIRYCVVEGSPQAEGRKPGEKVPGKRLLAELRKATDQVWLPQASILFRHAYAPLGIPVVADPDRSQHKLGDVGMTGYFDSEWGEAVDFCEEAWTEHYGSETGIIVVNARETKPQVGTAGGVAPGPPKSLWIGGTRGDALCGNPRNLTTADVTQMLHLAHYDPALYKLNPYSDATYEPSRVIAHELAHTMMVAHGNGLDDNGDGLLPPTLGRRRFDEYCDVKGEMEDVIHGGNLMLPGPGTKLLPLQREMARAAARLVPGAVLPDGVSARAGSLLPTGPCSADCNDAPAIRIEKIEIAETPETEVTNFTHSLLALPEGGTYSYWVYADLDNNPATGCSAQEPGQAEFLGAELRTLVTVNASGTGATAAPTVWQCTAGSWAEVQDGGISASAFVLSSVNHGAPLTSEGIVTIQIPNAVRGATGSHVRLQAVAAGESKLDLLPATGTGDVISLNPPDLRTCSVGPMVARPGQMVSITANGLLASRAVDIFIADVKAGTSSTDANGSVTIDVPVDSTAEEGVRAVEVIVQGGAAGASCALMIKAGAVTPATTATLAPLPNSNGWNNADVTVALSAVDVPGGTGIAGVSYSATGAQPIAPTTVPAAAASILIKTEGQTTIAFYATGNSGVAEAAHNVTVSLDKTKPTIAYAGNQGSYGVLDTVNITCTASDSLSGLLLNTCANISGPAWQFSLNGNSYTATAIDFASNINTATASFNIVVTYSDLCTLTRQFLDVSNPNATVLGNSLCAQLGAAEAGAARGNANAKRKAIDAYIRQLKGAVPGFLTEDQMKILISLAAAL